MKKKIIIICLTIIGIIALCAGGFFLGKSLISGKSNTGIVSRDDAVSVIYMDINPSIKIYLDKDNKVIDIEAVNEDAKDIIYTDYKNKEFDYVLRKIVENIVDKGYTEDKITVLVSTTGNIEPIGVLETVKQEFVTKDVEADVIMQDISATASEKAKEYGISEAKASYIEEMISENQELTYEDLKDKTINELNDLKNNSSEDKKESNSGSTSNGNSANANASNNTKYSCAAPSSNLKDPVWCDWYNKHPYNCSNPYPEKKESYQFSSVLADYAGLGGVEQIGGGLRGNKLDARGSYCIVYEAYVYTRSYKYSALVDSVTGELYDYKKEALPAPGITEEQALQVFLDYHHITIDDIRSESTIGYQILYRAIDDTVNHSDKQILVYNISGQKLDGEWLKGITVRASDGSIYRVG